jgi:hypothetical protein
MWALGYLPGPAAKTNTRRKAGLGLDDLKLARRISISISSPRKPIALVGAAVQGAIEKTILSVLGRDAFSHTVDP